MTTRRLLVLAAMVLSAVSGLALGSARPSRANDAGYPHQCFYRCAGCGGTCLGENYICSCQSGPGNCEE